MYRTLAVHIKGTAPLILHNGQLADPLNPAAKRLRSLTGKRKKTDADFEAIALAEWEGGLYLDADHQPIIPGENIEAGLIRAATRIRLGETVKMAVLSDGNWRILHDGPKTLDGLRADKRFHDTRGVRISKSRIMRSRPIFRTWELKFELMFEEEDLNEEQVIQLLEILSRNVGLGDFRPRFGRFKIISTKLVA
jgi:hypothetical protein